MRRWVALIVAGALGLGPASGVAASTDAPPEARARLAAQVGHLGPVHGLSVSADGRIAVSAALGDGDRVVVWETRHGRVLQTLSAPSFHPKGPVVLSADGGVVAAIGQLEVVAWDRRTGRILRSLRAVSEPFQPTRVALSPDGARLALTTSGGGLLQVPTEERDEAMTQHVLDLRRDIARSAIGPAGPLAFSPRDGRLAAAAGDAVGIWDPDTDAWTTHDAHGLTGIQTLDWVGSEDGAPALLAAAAGGVWRVPLDGAPATLVGASDEPFVTVEASEDGRSVLAETGAGALLRLRDGAWEPLGWRARPPGPPPSDGAASARRIETAPFALADGGETLWLADRQRPDIWRWVPAETPAPAAHFHGRLLRIRHLELSPDGQSLLLVPEAHDPWVFFLDGRPPQRLTLDGARPVGGALDAGAERVVIRSDDGRLRSWRLGQPDPAPTWTGELAGAPSLAPAAGRSVGAGTHVASGTGRIVACTPSGAVQVWEGTAEVPRALSPWDAPVAGAACEVALAPSGAAALVRWAGHGVLSLDLETGQVMQGWDAGHGELPLAVEPNGAAAWVQSRAGAVRIDLETGAVLQSAVGGRLVAAGQGRALMDRDVTSRGRRSAARSPDALVSWLDGMQGFIVEQPLPDLSLGAFSAADALVVTASPDGLVRLLNGETGGLLLHLALTEGGGWVVTDPEGRFDATDGGLTQGLHWVVGEETLALQQLAERFFHPGLLARTFGTGERLRAVEGLDDVPLHPAIALRPTEDGRVSLSLRERGGGIGRVQVLLNGKEIIADARDRLSPLLEGEASVELRLAEHPAFVEGGENRMEVRAFNGAGFVSGRGIQTLRPAAGAGTATRLPRFWGIFVGIDDYEGSAIDLSFADTDARSMAEAVRMGAEHYFGAEQVDIRVMTSDAERLEDHPTRANLRSAFAAAEAADANDILFVYIAGHGVALGGPDGDYWYLTQEADNLQLRDPALRSRVAVSSHELAEWLKAVPANKQALVADTCASGNLARALVSSRGMSESHRRRLERLKDTTGTWVLAGSTGAGSSLEAASFGGGLLTHALLAGLQGPALREDGYVDAATWFTHAQRTVPQLAEGIAMAQHPVLLAGGAPSVEVGRLPPEAQARIQVTGRAVFIGRPMFLQLPHMEDRQDLNAHLARALRAVADRDPMLEFVDSGELARSVRLSGTYRDEDGYLTARLVLRDAEGERTERTVEVPSGEGPEALAAAVVRAVRDALWSADAGPAQTASTTARR